MFSCMSYAQQSRTVTGQFAPDPPAIRVGDPRTRLAWQDWRSYTSEAIDTFVELMRHGKDDRVRGTAAQALLDRGWGKPKVEVVTEAGGGYLHALKAANVAVSVTSK